MRISNITNARFIRYPKPMVCSNLVVNNLFARLKYLVVLGSYWLIVVDDNLLIASVNML